MLVSEQDLPKSGTQARRVYDVLLSHEFMGREAIAAKSGIPEEKLWAGYFTDLRRKGLIEFNVGAQNGGNGRRPRMWRRTKQLTPEVVVVRKTKKRGPSSVRQDLAACFAQLQKLSEELEERIKDELLAKMRDL